MLIHTMFATALTDTIAEATRLHRSGYLSDAEFTALKARIIGTVTKQAPVTTPSTAIAPQLHPSALAMAPSAALMGDTSQQQAAKTTRKRQALATASCAAGTCNATAAMISAAHDGAPLPARFAYHQKVEQHINFSHYTAQRLSGGNKTAEIVLDETMSWLRRSTHGGFCAKTKSGEGDCRSSLKGSVELSAADSQTEHDAAIACISLPLRFSGRFKFDEF